MAEPTTSEKGLDDLLASGLPSGSVTKKIPIDLAGERLDRAAANLFPEYSRSRIQLWIDNGALLIDGQAGKRRQPVAEGMKLSLTITTEPQGDWQPQPIEFPVVYEDEHILVIDKPAGLVVHPGAGNIDCTLLNGLLHRYPDLAEVPRAGIVHRLDKDTSGLMVVARNLAAQNHLVQQLQSRSVTRLYQAIVMGGPTASGCINAPIGRNPKNRLKMAVVRNGKEAITHYRVLSSFRAHKLLQLKLETGRTHQIRVHLAHNNWPIVGDQLYAGKSRLPKGCSTELRSLLEGFSRQALHAVQLELIHPASGQHCAWQSELTADIQKILVELQSDV